MQKPVWEWTEEDIDTLIKEQRGEDLSWEYKKSAALDSGKKTEISKDISAMANSAGGVLFYGIDENKPNGPIRLDGGVDPSRYSREWLEQVIDSNIQRRIPGLRVHQIPMPRTGQHSVYAVYVPQSNLAPHMAADHRYHKRLGTITHAMEEYEVRDVARRSESPDLQMRVRAVVGPGTAVFVNLIPSVENVAPEPAFYATFRLFVEDRILPVTPTGGWRESEPTRLHFNGEPVSFRCFRYFWNAAERMPLLEGERFELDSLVIKLSPEAEAWGGSYKLGIELRSPKMPTRRHGLLLVLRNGLDAVILDRTFDLTQDV